MSTANDFRAAAGLRRWPPVTGDAAPGDAPPRGPGLFRVAKADREAVITNIRRLAGTERAPGSGVIMAMTWLLVLLDAGLLYVSFAAQYRFVFAQKGQQVPAAIEAGMLDVGMVLLSGLGIGLALAGKPSRSVRFLIMACAAASAGMNYADANPGSWRSVAAYVAVPVFLAIITDRVISVIRQHVLPLDPESAWLPLGRFLLAAGKVSALLALYLLRAALAPGQTARGLRRMVLDAAPVPGITGVPALSRDDLCPAATDSGGCRHTLPCPQHPPQLCESPPDGRPCGQPRPCGLHDPGPDHEYGDERPAANLCAADSGGLACGRPLPCPAHPALMPPGEPGPPAFGSKREAFEWHYRRHPQFGDRHAMSQVAKEIGERAGLQWGTARTYAAAILAADAISDAMDAARDEEAQR